MWFFGRLFSRQSHSESHETAPYFYQSMLIVNIIEVNYEENMKIVTFLKSLLINNWNLLFRTVYHIIDNRKKSIKMNGFPFWCIHLRSMNFISPKSWRLSVRIILPAGMRWTRRLGQWHSLCRGPVCLRSSEHWSVRLSARRSPWRSGCAS